MNLAYTMTNTSGDLDQLLSALAHVLASNGWRTAGVVQINTDRHDCHPCDMDVKVLPEGPTIRISQSLGKDARGCRLDPSALETAVAAVSETLLGDVDVLLINKFGKHEADGRGFRDVIAQAVERDIPVIAGVNQLNAPAFMEFSGGLAVAVPARIDALSSWLTSVGKVNRAVA